MKLLQLIFDELHGERVTKGLGSIVPLGQKTDEEVALLLDQQEKQKQCYEENCDLDVLSDISPIDSVPGSIDESTDVDDLLDQIQRLTSGMLM